MDSMSYLRVGMIITWGNRNGKLIEVKPKFVMVDWGGEVLEHFSPKIIFDEIMSKNIIIKLPEKILIYDATQSPEQAFLCKQYKDYLDRLSEEENPCSLTTRKKIIAEVEAVRNEKEENKLSASKLYRLYIRWEESNYRVEALIVKPKLKRQSKLKDESLDFINDVIWKDYLKLNGPSVKQVYSQYVHKYEALSEDEQKNINIIKRTRFYEFINSLCPIEVTRAREGNDAARKKARISDNKFFADHPMQRVEIDAVHLNLGLLSKERNEYIGLPIVYIAIDVYTRAIVGYVVSYGKKRAEQSSAVMQLIKNIISKNKTSIYSHNVWPLSGKPIDIVCDAGAAFNSDIVRTFTQRIHSNFIVTETATPWKKPFIERFNRTLRSQLAKNIPGYLGRRVDANSISVRIQDVATVTVNDFIELLEIYFLDVYHIQKHKGLQMRTPFDVARDTKYEGMFDFPVDLSKALEMTGVEAKRKLGERDGINFKLLHYSSRELHELYIKLKKHPGKKTLKVKFLYLNEDISKISVIDPFTLKIFVVPCKEVKEPISRSEYSAHIKGAENTKPMFKSNPTEGMTTVINKAKTATNTKAGLDKQKAKEQKKQKENKKGASSKQQEAQPLSANDLDQLIEGGVGKTHQEYKKKVVDSASKGTGKRRKRVPSSIKKTKKVKIGK